MRNVLVALLLDKPLSPFGKVDFIHVGSHALGLGSPLDRSIARVQKGELQPHFVQDRSAPLGLEKAMRRKMTCSR